MLFSARCFCWGSRSAMVGYCLYPATWVWRGSSLSSAHSKSISPAPSATLPACASHPSSAGAPEQAQRGCSAPQSPAASLSLPPVPHIMPKPQARPLGERCKSLPKVAWHSSTRISEALAASCLEDFSQQAAQAEGCGWCPSAADGREHGSPGLLVILRPLQTGPSLQGSETGPKVRLGVRGWQPVTN